MVPLVTDLKVECATDTFPRIFPVNRNLWGGLKSLLLSNAVASHWLHSREWQSLSSFQPALLAPLAQSFTSVFSAVNDIHQERKGQGFLLLKYKKVFILSTDQSANGLLSTAALRSGIPTGEGSSRDDLTSHKPRCSSGFFRL